MTQLGIPSSAAVLESSAVVQAVVLPAAVKAAEKPVKDTTTAEEAARQKFSSAERDGILNQLNKTLEAFDTHVSLSLDDKSHQTIIRVVDNETGKVIRQIPSEQMLRISERITELLGVIYDEKM